jgi:hypothetical protein
MAQVTIQEAVAMAKRDFLPIRGVVGVSNIGNTLIIYIETPETANQLPRTYYGYRVIVRVTGPIEVLK